MKFTPNKWLVEGGDNAAQSLYTFANNAVKTQMVEDIQNCMLAYQKKHPELILTFRESKTFDRFKIKFEEALNRKQQSWLDFAGVFGDFVACRFAPTNGHVIDTFSVANNIQMFLNGFLVAKGYLHDGFGIVGRDNSMKRLFIDLHPEEPADEIRVAFEIQVIASSDIAIAFSANSEKHLVPSFSSPFAIKNVNGMSLFKLLQDENFTLAKDQGFLARSKGFNTNDDFWSFFTRNKLQYR